jgi:hypothetical protein
MPINHLLFKYKGNCCARCGKSIEEMLKRYGVANKLFQFHHIDPSKKHPDYDNLIQRKISAQQLDELDKCVLLCEECHTILHGQKGEAIITLTRDLGDRVVEQKLKGNLVVDMQDMKIHFFFDDEILLDLYDVQRGDADPEVLTGIELRQDDRLIRMLLETQQTGSLLIRRHDDQRLMLEAKKLNYRACAVSPSGEFPLLKFNGLHDDGTLHLSVRKGQVVLNPKDGPTESRPVNPATKYNCVTPYANIRKALKKPKKGG